MKENPETDPDELLPIVPPAYHWEFSYAAERLSAEAVISVLGKARELLKKYEILKLAPPAGTSWKKLRDWLDARIKKAWAEKAVYPGLGAVLESFGLRYGADIAEALLKKANETDNPWESVKASLGDYDSFKKLLPENLKPLLRLRDERRKRLVTEEKLANAADSLEAGSKFWELVCRLNLSIDQADLIMKAYAGERLPRDCSPFLTRLGRTRGKEFEKEALENPYILYEETRLLPDWYKIDLDQIDLALFPPEDMREKIFANAEFELVEDPDDKRRLRALATRVLESEAGRGHTLVPLKDLICKANEYRAGDPLVNIGIDTGERAFKRHEKFFSKLFEPTEIALIDENGKEETTTALRLRRYAETGGIIREFVNSRIEKRSLGAKKKDWLQKTREGLF
ncbi:MAG: hypothetical protein HDQ93_00110, partial [Desulfovibrio sp.]|nr:hypothetical protein [Desulfovibrio sp.]